MRNHISNVSDKLGCGRARRQWSSRATTVSAADQASEGVEERQQILLLFFGQFCAEDEVEELDGVVEREKATVVHVRRRVLDPAQREGLDRSVADHGVIANRARRVEAFRLQVVHEVVAVDRDAVAGAALRFAGRNSAWPRNSAAVALPGSSLLSMPSFGAGGKSSSSWNSAIGWT